MNAISRPIRIASRNHDSIATLAQFTRECVASDMPDLSARQSAILLHANQRIGISVKDFAAAMNIPKPAVTIALNRLTELGLIQRGVDLDDKRRIAVRLTREGVAHVEAMAAALRGAM